MEGITFLGVLVIFYDFNFPKEQLHRLGELTRCVGHYSGYVESPGWRFL